MSDRKTQNAANDAFLSPTKLAARFTPKSPISAGSRTPSNVFSTNNDSTSPGLSKANLDAAMKQADSALAGVSSPPGSVVASKTSAKDAVASSVPNAGLNSNESSISSNARRELDLKHNDNAFHVVANLVLEKLQAKMAPGDTFLTLDAADIAHLDQVVPPSVRMSFVEAVRFRLEHNCPLGSDLNVHALTRECGELGLAAQGNSNPLLATLNASGMKAITIPVPPLTKTPTGGSTLPEFNRIPSFQNASESSASRTTPSRRALPPAYPGSSPSPFPMHLPPTPGGDSSSIGGSTITAGSVAEAHLSTTEALARQQLMAELREASNLMAESVTPEAATFWRNHVVDLQARLRALHGEGGDDVNFAAAEANRQLLEQYNRKTEPPPKYTVEPPKFEPIYQPTFHEPSYEQQIYQLPADRTFTPVVEPPAPKRQVVSITRKSAGQAKPMVDVIAPANLPGGYHFEAEIQGRRFLATVPAGGVHKGETFSCVMRDLETVGVGTPVGRWRDRLCDCGIYGLCHALVCMTILCPLLALSQVMTRLNYDFLGRASDVKRARTAWSTMWSILIFHVMMNGLIYTAYCYKWSENIPLSSADVAAVVLLNASLVFYAIYATLSTRASLREKYMIREHRFFDLEDCCCATFCMPCTICQMARHTAHYDNVDAVCCSATGLHQKGRAAHLAPSRGAEIV